MTNTNELLTEKVSGTGQGAGCVFAHVPKAQNVKMSLRSSKIPVKSLTQQLLSWGRDLPA